VNALQDQFVIEARELIRSAIADLIALERDGPSTERIDRVFRAFHTLKGSAGVVELPAMSLMLHGAEDLLASMRQGTLAVSADIVDQALVCLDQVSRWVDDFESTGALPVQAGETAHALGERLRALLPRSGAPQGRTPGRQSAPAANVGVLPGWVESLLYAERQNIASRLRQQRPSAVFAISYEPIAGCFYNGDDPLQLMRQIPNPLAFAIAPRDAFPPLTDLDPYACNLRLCAISAGDRTEIVRIFRLVPDQVHIVNIPVDALPMSAAAAGGEDVEALIRTLIQAQCELLRIPRRPDDFAGCTGSATRVAESALRHGGRAQLAESVERAGAQALSQKEAAPLLAALENALAAFGSDQSPKADDNNSSASAVSQTDAGERPIDRVLRVNEAKIDELVTLAGELIVAKNALAHSSRRIDQELGGHEIASAIRRDYDAIDRLVAELHGTVLQLRMVPMAQVFQQFPRMVRDIARQLNKKVALVTRGDSTEADKTIVDRLFEPLVHLVRNAVDHGVETSEQRRAAGKPDTATISIDASRVGDRFIIEISDDGRGIDPDLVRRKASEKKLILADELAALSDSQAIDLIFAAGFSTVAEVSDISGRGIGMDVVRTAVERIGGHVSVASRVGAGTSVRLDLPTTIAISHVMVVESGGQLFGVSMDTVSETVRLTPERISQIKNNDGFVLRERIVPVISLAELMKLPERSRDPAAARLFLVIETGGNVTALEIDAIRDRLEVVLKPMQGLLAAARGYSGTTVLGNGQILLVLDLKEIMP
jgi:two-component system, chemotaxis family, sensor kinase CheA